MPPKLQLSLPGDLKQYQSFPGAMRRAFRLSAPELLWPAFTGYVLPKLMFNSAAWCLVYRKAIDLIEKLQKRYT